MENGSTPNMCVPLLPNEDHPTARSNLPASRSLPWSDCYQHSALHATLGVKNENKDESQVITIEQPSVLKHSHLVWDDKARRMNLLKASGRYEEPKPVTRTVSPTAETTSEHYGGNQEDYGTDDDYLSLGDTHSLQDDSSIRNHEESVLSDLVNHAEDDDQARPIEMHRPVSETVPLISVEYDLSTITDFADPRELLQEIEKLKM